MVLEVDLNVPFTVGLRRMFYLITPNETTFRTVEEVPDYLVGSAPYFTSFILIELLVSLARKDGRVRINDGLTSICAGILSKFNDFVTIYLELSIFTWIHTNYRIVDFDWSSPVAWVIAFFGVDFGYYWFHRMAHEVNLFWAVHQAHHSSEDYNLTTALRQSVIQRFISWFFYQPLALLVSPVFFAVHSQFCILYQFWIHTQYVRSLGPLEYILSTPSHHRVHHGRNRYCIDKNYAGTLVIWDRMFGTFAPESEEVVYGLTHPIETFDPISIQTCHFQHMWRTFWQMDGFWNKLAVIWKGPGWSPGKPRQGEIEDIPDVHAPVPSFDTTVPWWCNAYTIVHFGFMTVGFTMFMTMQNLTVVTITCVWTYILTTMTSFGFIFEKKWLTPIVEIGRCTALILVHLSSTQWLLSHIHHGVLIQQAAFYVYCASVAIWSVVLVTGSWKKVPMKSE